MRSGRGEGGRQAGNFIKETPAQLFFCQFFEIFENIFFMEDLRRTTRSSRLQMFDKVDVLRNFAAFTGEHLC